jgi:hypothetical protein
VAKCQSYSRELAHPLNPAKVNASSLTIMVVAFVRGRKAHEPLEYDSGEHVGRGDENFGRLIWKEGGAVYV